MKNSSRDSIVIICGGIESQKDGIGDYSRTLANELNDRYHVVLCAINDEYISETKREFDKYQIIRLPSCNSWAARANNLSQLILEYKPVWISFQLSPFGLHKKGVMYESIKYLIPVLKPHKIHFFIHELWLGAEKGASIKRKLWGFMIKYFLLKLIKHIAPFKIYVSCEINQFLLKNEGIETGVVPVFSNISIDNTVNTKFLIKKISQKCGIDIESNTSQFIVVGFFGMIHPYWNPDEIFRQLDLLAKHNNQQLLFLFIGKIDEGAILKVLSMLPAGALYYKTGILSNAEISGFIQLCATGITSNPEIMLGKSGTVAAFILHRKPVIVYKNEIIVSNFKLETPISELVLYPHQLQSRLLSLIKSMDVIPTFEAKQLALKMSIDMKV